jgi:hypothetical protein
METVEIQSTTRIVGHGSVRRLPEKKLAGDLLMRNRGLVVTDHRVSAVDKDSTVIGVLASSLPKSP